MNTGLFRGVLPFVAVAEAASFSKAAERLGLTKAAVSKAVSELETELGVVLLQRSSRAVSLTADGARFFEQCKPAVNAVWRARSELRQQSDALRGEVKLSLSFVLEPYVVPAIVALHQQYPELRFSIQVSDRMARFADEGVDVAVRVGRRKEASLSAKVLRRTRWSTVASARYLKRAPALERPQDLRMHHLLGFRATDGRPRSWTFKGERLFELHQATLLSDFGPSLVRAATQGLGVCQALDFMTTHSIREGHLVSVLDDFALEGPPITAVHTLGRRPTSMVKAVLGALGEVFSSDPSFS
ncbi:MAG: LysR substrate-binding domain-containing protein [Polyangiaceae bacterium]